MQLITAEGIGATRRIPAISSAVREGFLPLTNVLTSRLWCAAGQSDAHGLPLLPFKPVENLS